jgi:hypothetical protein
MTYIFMAVHYPAEGKLDEVYASMRQMAASAVGTPNTTVFPGESRPREYFHLESAPQE